MWNSKSVVEEMPFKRPRDAVSNMKSEDVYDDTDRRPRRSEVESMADGRPSLSRQMDETRKRFRLLERKGQEILRMVEDMETKGLQLKKSLESMDEKNVERDKRFKVLEERNKEMNKKYEEIQKRSDLINKRCSEMEARINKFKKESSTATFEELVDNYKGGEAKSEEKPAAAEEVELESQYPTSEEDEEEEEGGDSKPQSKKSQQELPRENDQGGENNRETPLNKVLEIMTDSDLANQDQEKKSEKSCENDLGGIKTNIETNPDEAAQKELIDFLGKWTDMEKTFNRSGIIRQTLKIIEEESEGVPAETSGDEASGMSALSDIFCKLLSHKAQEPTR